MNPDYLQELLGLVEKAEADDVPASEINAAVSARTRGLYPDAEALRAAIAPAPDDPAPRGMGVGFSPAVAAEQAFPLGDRVRMLIQGLSQGWADEVLGDSGRVEQIREEQGLDALGSEMMSALLPASGFLKVTQGMGGWPRALAAGGAGAAYGATNATGESEGSLADRINDDTVLPATALGGLLSMGGVGLGTGINRLARTMEDARTIPARTVDMLEETTGVPRYSMSQGRERVREMKQGVRERVYQPLEETVDRMESPDLTEVLAEMRGNPQTTQTVRAAMGSSNQPSFLQAQNLRQRLQARGLRDDVDAFDDVIGDMLPGYQQGNRQYRRASGVGRALEDGWKMYDKPGDDLAEALRRLQTPAERQAFRSGQVNRIIEMIGRRDERAVGLLHRYMDAGESQRRVLRTLYPEGEAGEAAYNAFLSFVKDQKPTADAAARINRFLRNTGAVIGGGLLAGAVGGRVAGLLGS